MVIILTIIGNEFMIIYVTKPLKQLHKTMITVERLLTLSRVSSQMIWEPITSVENKIMANLLNKKRRLIFSNLLEIQIPYPMVVAATNKRAQRIPKTLE